MTGIYPPLPEGGPFGIAAGVVLYPGDRVEVDLDPDSTDHRRRRASLVHGPAFGTVAPARADGLWPDLFYLRDDGPTAGLLCCDAAVAVRFLFRAKAWRVDNARGRRRAAK